jgi:sulfite reductase alpha subunit-like flavoprotein
VDFSNGVSSLEGAFIPWLKGFREHLLDKYPLPAGQLPIPNEVQLPPKWILQNTDEVSERSRSENYHAVDAYRWEQDHRQIPGSLTATLIENKRLTPSTHWQDVRHIILSVPDESLNYSPGDTISILPKNFPDDVEVLVNLMNWSEQADKPIIFIPGVGLRNSSTSPPPSISYFTLSSHLTLRILLTEYLDIWSIPRRSFFANISHYTTNAMHKERLLEFANPEFVDEFWDYTTRSRRSILEVLQEFDSVKIPWQHAATALPVLRARQFSLASGGSLKHPTIAVPNTVDAVSTTNFELLVAIVRYKTIIKRFRQGVCTRYLSSLKPGSSTLRIQLNQNINGSSKSNSGLKPTRTQLLGPAVLIGPGTGLAPLRSIIHERAGLIKNLRSSQDITNATAATTQESPIILIYGGRNADADYFFSEEWDKFMKPATHESDGEMLGLRVLTAFSRDQQQKIYVQDRIKENKELIVNVLRNKGGSVFVCGSSGRMPLAVREALVECFREVFDGETRNLGDNSDEEDEMKEEQKPRMGGITNSISSTSTLTMEVIAGDKLHARYFQFRKKAENYLSEIEKAGRYKQETW